MLFLIALPNPFIDFKGSSKIALKNPVIELVLDSIKLKKSLNANDNVSNVIEKKSATFWFSFKTSVNFAKAATIRPIPTAFKALPIFFTPPAVS